MKITPNISVQAALTALQEARSQPARPQTARRVLDSDDGGRPKAFDPDDVAARRAPPPDGGPIGKKPRQSSTAKARRSTASDAPDRVATQSGGHLVAAAFRREAVGPGLGRAGANLGLVVDIKV